MKLDVYACANDHEFAVKENETPNLCPICRTWDFEFSHEVDLLEVE